MIGRGDMGDEYFYRQGGMGGLEGIMNLNGDGISAARDKGEEWKADSRTLNLLGGSLHGSMKKGVLG